MSADSLISSDPPPVDPVVENLFDAGDKVVATGRYSAKNKATGTEIDAQFAHIWTVVAGKAKQFQQYADTAQTSAAVGS